MNKLTLVRHGISIGNEIGVIQGNENYGLSRNGIEKLKNQDFSRLINITNIYTSNLQRAMETAEIIKNKINFYKKIKIDPNLREVSAGILEGNTKDYCKYAYPKEYEIYSKRGDYNDILNASTWQENQARAILFLSKYLQCDNQNDIVVSHAAFIRCMYNLLNNRYRNTQFDIPNGSIFEIINPMSKLNIVDFPIAKTAIVKMIETFDNKYIVKFKNNHLKLSDYLEMDVLNYLNKKMNVPSVIQMDNTEYGQTKVMKYLDGIHKFGDLKDNDIVHIFKEVSTLNKLLKKYDNDFSPDGNIKKDLLNCQKNLFTDFAKEDLQELINDEKFNNYLKKVDRLLIHNDLHRSNLLIEDDEIHIIDFENMKKYPKDLQLATLICSCFLLESPNSNYEDYLKYANLFDKCDKDIIRNLIIYRLLYGLAFFEKRLLTNDCDESDKEIHKKYIKVLKGMKNERSSY